MLTVRIHLSVLYFVSDQRITRGEHNLEIVVNVAYRVVHRNGIVAMDFCGATQQASVDHYCGDWHMDVKRQIDAFLSARLRTQNDIVLKCAHCGLYRLVRCLVH